MSRLSVLLDQHESALLARALRPRDPPLIVTALLRAHVCGHDFATATIARA
jgi:hypothetical protein